MAIWPRNLRQRPAQQVADRMPARQQARPRCYIEFNHQSGPREPTENPRAFGLSSNSHRLHPISDVPSVR